MQDAFKKEVTDYSQTTMEKEKQSLIPACSELDVTNEGKAFARNTLPLPSEGSYLNFIKN